MTFVARTLSWPVVSLLALSAAPCLAQTAMSPAPLSSVTAPDDPAPPGTAHLTPEQREAAIEAGAARAQHLIDNVDGGVSSDHRVHGEVGVEIGTGGRRAAFGSAVVPLGDSGAVAIAVETDRNHFFRRRPRQDSDPHRLGPIDWAEVRGEEWPPRGE